MLNKFIVCSMIMICACMAWDGYAASDIRCCVDEIARNPDGSIKRSRKVIDDFKSIYPCPATGLKYGPCAGWQVDHVISLACGGLDVIYNLQWLPVEIKTCKENYCKDRWERKIYCIAR